MNLHGGDPYGCSPRGTGFQVNLLNKGLASMGLSDPTVHTHPVASPASTSQHVDVTMAPTFLPSHPPTDTSGEI